MHYSSCSQSFDKIKVVEGATTGSPPLPLPTGDQTVSGIGHFFLIPLVDGFQA